jgi:hypothetical protein
LRKAPLGFSRRDARDLDRLVPRALAGDEPDVRGWESQRNGDQVEGGLVRLATLRRSADAKLPGISVAADDPRFRRAGNNAQPQMGGGSLDVLILGGGDFIGATAISRTS